MRLFSVLPFVCWSGLASAYPGGTAVSLGSNPLFSHGGNMGPTDSSTVFSAPSDQIMVITDVTLGLTQAARNCEMSLSVTLKTSTEDVLAEFAIGMPDLNNHPGTAQGYHFVSGIPILPGQSLVIETTEKYAECSSSIYRLRYTLAGYSAQP